MSVLDRMESRLRTTLRALADALPEDDIGSILGLIGAREWGVALENLCTQLYEYDVEVPGPILDEIAELGRRMRLDPQLWEILTRAETST